jgi:hypothetical protein
MNQWRFHQSYWERLRRDQIRLQSFTYSNYGAPSYYYYRGGQSYQLNQYGADLLRRAVSSGYEEGYRAGLADRQDGWRFDCESSDAFTDATYGYDGYYVNVVSISTTSGKASVAVMKTVTTAAISTAPIRTATTTSSAMS